MAAARVPAAMPHGLAWAARADRPDEVDEARALLQKPATPAAQQEALREAAAALAVVPARLLP
jgi:hypothetical protein